MLSHMRAQRCFASLSRNKAEFVAVNSNRGKGCRFEPQTTRNGENQPVSPTRGRPSLRLEENLTVKSTQGEGGGNALCSVV